MAPITKEILGNMRWGSHRYCRYVKVDSGNGDARSTADPSVGATDHQRQESASAIVKWNENKKNVGDREEEEIEAARQEKVMAVINPWKKKVLRRELATEKGDDKAHQDDDVEVSAAEVAEEELASSAEKEARPWNLRKRKAVCEKGVRKEEKKVNVSPARPVRRVPPGRRERTKLAVAAEEKSASTEEKEPRPWNLRKRKAVREKSVILEEEKVNVSPARPVRRAPPKRK